MAFAVMNHVVRFPFVLYLHDPLAAAGRAFNSTDFNGVAGFALADRLPITQNLLDLSVFLADDADAANVELAPANHSGEIRSDARSNGAFENDSFSGSLQMNR